MSKAVLIISGYNIRAVIAFCRWATTHAVPFHLLARDASDPIFMTAYGQQVCLTRSNNKLDAAEMTQWLGTLRTQHGYTQILLLPSTEFFNRFMLAHRSALEQAGGVVPLTTEELYQDISDKYSFGAMCKSAGIPVPQEFTHLPATFPFVAKPKSYAAINQRQLKPHLIYDTADLERFEQQEFLDDYYFQQYIKGRSLYLLAYIPHHGAPVLFAQENLIQQNQGGSVILARHHDFHHTAAARQYIELLREANFTGLIMVEVRYHEATDQYYMIEANPRLWGPMQLLVDHGVDIFGTFLREHGFSIDLAPRTPPSSSYYFWSGGLRDHSYPSYHQYSAASFIDHFQAITRHDLFLRPDSMDLYHHELSSSPQT